MNETLQKLKIVFDGILGAGNLKNMEDAATLLRLYHDIENVLSENVQLKAKVKRLETQLSQPIPELPETEEET